MADDCLRDRAGRYEFDAPSHVVDFKQLANEPCDDEWFDRQAVDQPHATPKHTATVGPMRIAVTDAVSKAADSTPRDCGAVAKIQKGDEPRRVSKRKRPVGLSSQDPKKSKKTENHVESSHDVNNEEQNCDTEKELTSSDSRPEEESSSVDVLSGYSAGRPGRLLRSNKQKMTKNPYVPVAEHIMQLQTRTPPRFRELSRQERAKGPPKAKAKRLQLTRPQSPKFATRLRSRPSTVKSSAQLEAEEEHNKSTFKAQALNKKILERRETVKKPVVKEPTVQEAFTMHIEKRLQERQNTKSQDEPQSTFKAQELPKKILEGVVEYTNLTCQQGVPEKKVRQPTLAHSPAFTLTKKDHHIDVKAEEVKPLPLIKHTPVPQFGTPFQPMLQDKRHTEVCPFSFEQREQARKKLKAFKEQQQQEEEEVPLFKAQPLPHFDKVSLPERKKLEPTKPEPFRLLLDERGTVKSDRLEQMIKEEQKKIKETATFKARPNKVTQKEPFQPKKEDRPAVVVESFELATERRARNRDEFHQHLCEKEAVAALLKEKLRQEEEEKQKMDLAILRQQQVHKAQPIRHYRSVEVKKSEVPLTIPQSPNLSDRFRL
ncbi:targeting protein for Xklp2 isoform X2 [Hippocampus zosterae]|uniref:targeting protein for Xklp2 isoform X2 n=1 Tax=Hippocampus zosterae TaxID=109293 RepID=UPI00223DE444|nr:targeting protein for Xklp2 isoform X2 [Hippocampus zosterae]